MNFLTSGMGKYILLGAIFLLVLLLVMMVSLYVSSRVTMRRRVEEAANNQPREGLSNLGNGGGTLRNDRGQTAWTGLVDKIEKAGVSLADTKSDTLRAKLIAAGFTSPYAPRWFTLIRLCTTFLLPATFLLFALSKAQPPSWLTLYLASALAALFGLYLPNLVVAAKADRRRQEIINGFPDALDLMLVCVEAGLGAEAAFDRVGREMAESHPLVSNMLANVVLEMRAGRSREEAMKRMADRVGVDEIRSFSTLLIQSEKLGSSIATTLRVYAAEMREKRRMRAEEKAHRLPVLLSIPLVACMLPVMIGVLMLPAVIRVITTILPAMGK